MKRVAVVVMVAFVGSAQAQIPVTDVLSITNNEINYTATLAEWGKNAASWAKQAKEMANQAKAWIQQGEDMKRQYDAISGIRNFGNLFNNRILRRNVPDDWTGIYDTAGDGLKFGEEATRLADVRGWESKIRAGERLVGIADDDLARIQKRSQDMATTNKALGQRAYKAQPGLLDQIENAMNKINGTTDQKAILEVNGRLTGEAAAQAWQTNNILLLAQMQESERDLAREQRLQMYRREWNSKNTTMAGFEP